jgi:hypothetical protein
VLGGGCAPEPAVATKQFVPSSEGARAALAAVLEDWHAGLAPRHIDRLDVGVEVIDKQRKEGQELADFEILGEVPGEGGRCFAVRLVLRDPDAEFKARFVVVGINPLWVFRQEDYDLLNHWEHAMPDEQPPDSEPADDGNSKPEGDGKQISEDAGEAAP